MIAKIKFLLLRLFAKTKRKDATPPTPAGKQIEIISEEDIPTFPPPPRKKRTKRDRRQPK